MIEQLDNQILITPANGAWEARHSGTLFGGPLSIATAGGPLIENSRFYVDDVAGDRAVVTTLRSFRKGGTAVVASSGYFPFGSENRFAQTCRYAANHVRMTFDLRWHRGAEIRRHLGMGTVFLPGRWTRFFLVPPALHSVEGVEPAWRRIPEFDGKECMIGHWHRPPLAVAFEREDGAAVEIGTGSDLWRWEYSLGHGPESGSYKIVLQEKGILFVREPLMCCEPFMPEPRDYRFSWYAAWRSGHWQTVSPSCGRQTLAFRDGRELDSDQLLDIRRDSTHGTLHLHIDYSAAAWPETCCAVLSPAAHARGERSHLPCWACAGTQKIARRTIRQLAALGRPGHLVVSGLHANTCWDPVHVGRTRSGGRVHGDLCALLDFSSWARTQLGEQWHVTAQPGGLTELPSLQGLFGPNGFATGQMADE